MSVLLGQDSFGSCRCFELLLSGHPGVPGNSVHLQRTANKSCRRFPDSFGALLLQVQFQKYLLGPQHHILPSLLYQLTPRLCLFGNPLLHNVYFSSRWKCTATGSNFTIGHLKCFFFFRDGILKSRSCRSNFRSVLFYRSVFELLFSLFFAAKKEFKDEQNNFS